MSHLEQRLNQEISELETAAQPVGLTFPVDLRFGNALGLLIAYVGGHASAHLNTGDCPCHLCKSAKTLLAEWDAHVAKITGGAA